MSEEEINKLLPLIANQQGYENDASFLKLVEQINTLINHKFETLVYILYRIDVNEQKLKTMLKENNGENAAFIISRLLVQRQWQKEKSKFNNTNTPDIPEDEKW